MIDLRKMALILRFKLEGASELMPGKPPTLMVSPPENNNLIVASSNSLDSLTVFNIYRITGIISTVESKGTNEISHSNETGQVLDVTFKHAFKVTFDVDLKQQTTLCFGLACITGTQDGELLAWNLSDGQVVVSFI